MAIALQRPSSLNDGILDITNGENSLIEFSGTLADGLEWVELTYTSEKNEKNQRDSFTIKVKEEDLDSNKNFVNQVNLGWNSSGNYELARISTNLYGWTRGNTDEQKTTFKKRTQIDPEDAALAGFTIKNNRSDRNF